MYEFNMTLAMPFADAMKSVREALMEEQLGIVSEVDVQAIFRNKMGKEIPPYQILGACNPKLADRVISVEPNAGALLPCNLVVRAEGDDTTVVSFLDPVTLLDLTHSDAAKAVGNDAKAMLQRVAARLTGR
jgi:uncharacterized protein (DUF302 family)